MTTRRGKALRLTSTWTWIPPAAAWRRGCTGHAVGDHHVPRRNLGTQIAGEFLEPTCRTSQSVAGASRDRPRRAAKWASRVPGVNVKGRSRQRLILAPSPRIGSLDGRDDGRPPRRRPTPTGSSRSIAFHRRPALTGHPRPSFRSGSDAHGLPVGASRSRLPRRRPGPLSRCPRLARGSFTFVAGATPNSSAERNDPTGKPWAFSRGPEAARRVAAKLRTISQHPGLCGHPSPCGRAWFRETPHTFVFDSGKAIADGLDRRRRRWEAKNPANGGIGVTAELASVERCSAPATRAPNPPPRHHAACLRGAMFTRSVR